MSDEINRRYERITDIQCENYNKMQGQAINGFFCEKCKNKGLIAVKTYRDGDFKTVFVPCSCQGRLQAEQNKVRSGFGEIARKYNFENFDMTKEYSKIVIEKAKSNLNQDFKWFFIGGQVGSGKTHICTAISECLLDRGLKVKYISWRDLMTDLKKGFSGKETFFDFDEFKRVQILFVDDFLHGKATEFELEKAFELIDFRYRSDKKTIISSELLSGEILAMSESVGSRIIEKAKGCICDIKRDAQRNHRIQQSF